MEDQLKSNISEAIAAFNLNRVEILRLAFEEGGNQAVIEVEKEYDALRDAYYELMQKQLDQNNHLFNELITATNNEVDNLKESVNQLSMVNDIINLTSAVVNLIGRVLIVLAI